MGGIKSFLHLAMKNNTETVDRHQKRTRHVPFLPRQQLQRTIAALNTGPEDRQGFFREGVRFPVRQEV